MSAKGRNVRRPVRVALSIMPIADRAWKPRVSRIPQPLPSYPGARAAVADAPPVASRVRRSTMASVAASPRTP